MLDYILEKIVDALCFVMAIIDHCTWVAFTSTVNFAINAIVNFFQLRCVQAVVITILNFISLAIRSFFSLRCVQNMCERILDVLRLVQLAEHSFSNQTVLVNLLRYRLQFARRKLDEWRADRTVKQREVEFRLRELNDTSNGFYVSEVIRVRHLFLYAQQLYQTTKAVLLYLQAHKNCEAAQSTINLLSDLQERVS